MTTPLARKKLDTAIEKEVFSLNRTIAEHVVDFTILRIRRSAQRDAIDPEILTAIMDTVRVAVHDGFQKNVDGFMQKVAKQLDDFAGSSDPLPPTGT